MGGPLGLLWRLRICDSKGLRRRDGPLWHGGYLQPFEQIRGPEDREGWDSLTSLSCAQESAQVRGGRRGALGPGLMPPNSPGERAEREGIYSLG